MMDSAFAGKVAIVTGATGGIGQELARQLAGADARVGLIARRHGVLEDLARAIAGSGGVALAAPADVTKREELETAVQSVRRGLGPVDVLIASAGVCMPTLLEPVNLADVEAMVRVNLLGVVYAFAAVLPEMLRRQSGRLAAVASLAAYGALPGESGYCASKAAVKIYLDGLRAQLCERGIVVTTLCPGFVRTQMTAENTFWMPGLLSPHDAARRMLVAICRGRGVYNFPWLPTLLAKVVARLPDPILARLMKRYNEGAARRYRIQ
jgi:short-subunit dehydrogenase